MIQRFVLANTATIGQRYGPVSLLGVRGVVHGSQKPAANAEIDFSALGLKYPPTHTPSTIIKKTWWTPPPEPGAAPVYEDLPFAVERTSPGQSLPVYTAFKGGGTKVVTVLRKCRGDIDVLKEEMEKVCGQPVSVGIGKLVVTGNFHARIKMWLSGLGF
jgi:hypothetical protein